MTSFQYFNGVLYMISTGSLYPSMSCPADWVEFQSACYKYVQEPIDWSKAEVHVTLPFPTPFLSFPVS